MWHQSRAMLGSSRAFAHKRMVFQTGDDSSIKAWKLCHGSRTGASYHDASGFAEREIKSDT